MDLRDSLNRYYYDVTVSDLRQISRTGGGELSYNSIMYLDVISYQRAQGECTVSTLANTLHITKSAVTIKVNELERLGPAQPPFDAEVLVLYDEATDLKDLTARLAALAGQGKRVLARRQAGGALRARETMDLRGGRPT